jgi:DNA-binding XRE family transcriptional regulator
VRGPRCRVMNGAGRELAPPFTKHGGYRLPGLKHWRLRRGLRQVDLAQRTGQASTQLSKIELGRKGCNPALAQRLAEVLEVDLEDLRTKYDDEQEAQTASIPGRPTTAHRYVQRPICGYSFSGSWAPPTRRGKKGS